MKNQLFLPLVLMIASCATYIETSVRDREESPGTEEAYQKEASGNSLIKAIKTDVETFSDAASYVSDELTKRREGASPARHQGEDSNLCVAPQAKQCSAKDGCVCQ